MALIGSIIWQSFGVQVNAEYFSKDSLAMVQCDLQKDPLIAEVVYQESLVDLLNANLEKVGMVLGIFILLLKVPSTTRT